MLFCFEKMQEGLKQTQPFDCGVPKTPPPPLQMYGHTDMNIDDSAWRMVTAITVITVRCGYCKTVHTEDLLEGPETFMTALCPSCNHSYCAYGCFKKHIKQMPSV